jgi:GR25 family glycosyltransferase involved in LPS biosynthesis
METNYFIFNQSGRFGNAVFRYMAYVMLQKGSNHFKYILDTDFSNIRDTDTKDDGMPYAKPTTVINEDNFFDFINTENPDNHDNPDNLNISKLPTNTNISLHGYFQYDKIYLQNKDYILDFIERHKNDHLVRTDNETYLTKYIIDDMLLEPSKRYENVIHIRLGDFNGRPDFIETEYMLQLFATVKEIFYKKTAIVIETPTSDVDIKYLNTILDWFKENSMPIPVIESNDMLTDYNIMKQAKTVISSMSTLCWAAAYFSKSLERIYMPNYNFFDIEDRKNGYFKTPIENTVLYNVKTTKFADIKVVILTLEKYSHRMNKVYDLINKLSQIGLQCSLYYGVNGEDIRVTTTESPIIYKLEYNSEVKYYDMSIRTNRQRMTAGELGCAWSHLNIYKSLLEEMQVDKYLIFEDDVEIVESLEYLYQCLSTIPAEIDMCHIAKSDWYPFVLFNNVNEMWYDVKKSYFNRLTAYIVSKIGGQKILDYAKDHIDVPADDILSNMFNNYKLRVYVPSKYIFHEPENTVSIIGNFVGK